MGTCKIADIYAGEKAFLRSLKIYTVEWYFDINQIPQSCTGLLFSAAFGR